MGQNMTGLDRRRFLAAAGGTLAAPLVARAQGAAVTLKLHHFLPAVSNPQKLFLEPWAEMVNKASGGRIKIDIYPSMQLGGRPPELYNQARDGVADIIWTLPGNTPGRFPRIETFELPFVASRRALPNSLAVAEFAQTHLMDEFKEVKPLCLWAHDHGLIHASKAIEKMEDLRGLKLRFPTRLAGEALKVLGANAIGMPIPQVPQALAQKVIDGCVVPWEVVPAIKVHEMVKFHTEIPGSPTLYTSTFVLAMNLAKYNGMPADLRKIIDDHSGVTAAAMAGKVWDRAGLPVIDMVKARGNKISAISTAERDRWKVATQPVIDTWLKETKEKNINGEKLLADAKALLAKHENAA
jgi:TRAP-type C4-dicarboxylate transport system substrate-binding protein